MTFYEVKFWMQKSTIEEKTNVPPRILSVMQTVWGRSHMNSLTRKKLFSFYNKLKIICLYRINHIFVHFLWLVKMLMSKHDKVDVCDQAGNE